MNKNIVKQAKIILSGIAAIALLPFIGPYVGPTNPFGLEFVGYAGVFIVLCVGAAVSIFEIYVRNAQ